MIPYGFQTAGRIIAGPGTVGHLGELISSRGAKRVLVVTDPGVSKAGLVEEPVAAMRERAISVDVLDRVTPEPPAESVEALFSEIRHQHYDMLVGIGGGSALDVTKLLSVRYTNDQTVTEMVGTDKVGNKGVPTALIPTTAGTGSEVTPNAIITLVEQQLKVGIVSRHLLPELVIADPTLTLGLPPAVTAATGMDAFIHALESYISKKSNPVADAFCTGSVRLISRSIERAYTDGSDLNARHDMLIGSMLGGMALTASGTAAVHALAYPLGGKYGISHGVSNSMLLVPVLEYNLDVIHDRLVDIGEAMGLETRRVPPAAAALMVQERIKELVAYLHIPARLEVFGAKRADLDELATAASRVERLLSNNPKPMSLDAIRHVYETLFD